MPICHHPLLLQEVCTQEYHSTLTTQSTGCPRLPQPGDAPAIFVSCQKLYLNGHLCSTCIFLESPASLSTNATSYAVGSTNFLPFLEGFANIQVEVVVICIFNQSDDIYSFKYIGDNAYKCLASSINAIVSIYRRCSVLAHLISHC